MGAMVGRFFQVWFAIGLVVNMLWCTALMKLLQFVPMKKLTRQGLSAMLVQVAWRLSLALAPWMWCQSSKDSAKNWKLVLDNLAEHDAKAARGEGVLWRCRTYMDKALFKLPILSTVCLSIGHFPVYFKSTEEGKFTVDKEKMAKVEEGVDEHINSGGWLCFFPEGQVNKTPETILPFRYGGMKKALDTDARLIMFVAVGNTTVWPKREQVGGFPGKVAYGAKALAPHGAKALVAELREKCTEEEKTMEDDQLLAKYAQGEMQKHYDDLSKSKPSGLLSLLWASAPAVALYLAFGVSVSRLFFK